jgi:phenylalanyl-tRNA synthetase alpha chain
MQQEITQYTSEINSFQPKNNDELEAFRIRFLGTKGIIKDLFEAFKTVSSEEKRVMGKVLNEFKQMAEAKYQTLKESLETLDTGADSGTGPDSSGSWI